MQNNFSTSRILAVSSLTFFAAMVLSCSSVTAQEQDRGNFQFSSNGRAAPQNTDNRTLTPLELNDLRAPNNVPRSFAPQPLPNRDGATNQSSNSILNRNSSAVQSSLGDQRPLPKFNPDAFNEPPQSNNIAQPLNPRVSTEQFRQPDINSGNVRPVSAIMQDDGRNSAMGTQPIGNTPPRTQTMQQRGEFNRNQPPVVNQNLSGNNAQAPTRSPFEQVSSAPVRQQPVQQLQPQNRQNGPNSMGNQNQRMGNRGMGNPGMGNNNQRMATNPSINQRMTAAPNQTMTQPPATKVETSVAKRLMGQYAIDSAPQPLPGQPMSIQQMLESTSFQNRPAMVDQYWKTYQAWCNMMCSAQQVNALSQVTPPNNPAEKNLLNTANSIARNELLDSEIKLAKAQARLQKFLPNSQNELMLPLPSDQPVISSYKTHYDYYSSRRAIPNEIRHIATALPKMLTLISNRAQTAQDSQSSMQQIRQFVQGGQAPVSEVLQAVHMWSESNKHVVASVVDYNRSIAAYSLNVMGSSKSPDQMAVALVGKPKTQSTPATQGPNVRQATLPGELQQGRRMPSPAGQTFNPRSGMPPSNNGLQNPGGNLGTQNGGNFNSNGSNFSPNGGAFRGN
jgi:hypothetical protein